MATILDIGLIKGISGLFPFLLVLVLSYAVLNNMKPFKDNPAFAALAAVCFAFMTLLFPLVHKTIMMMSPWFMLFLVFSIFTLIAFQAFGVESSTIVEVVTGKTPGEFGGSFFWWVIGIMLLIALGSLSQVISTERGFTALTAEGIAAEEVVDPGSETATFFGTITHPKVLGMALVFLIGLFTVKFMTERWEIGPT